MLKASEKVVEALGSRLEGCAEDLSSSVQTGVRALIVPPYVNFGSKLSC
jgi:hypothetical protein